MFDHVFRAGKRINHPLFQGIIAPNNLPISRFAFVVGTKISKHAVDRNRIKRLLREAICHLLPTIQSGFDCIFIARKNFSEQREMEIEQTVFETAARTHLLKNEAKQE